MYDRNDLTDQKNDEIEYISTVPTAVDPERLPACFQGVQSCLKIIAGGSSGYEYQVFISHRGTRKKEIAFPIMVIFSYFCGPRFAVFDQTTFQLGESNDTVISKALSKCAHCLVLVSEDFFQSKWTVAEADAFLKESEKVNAQEQRKVISLFIGFSPGQCRSLKSNFCHEDNEFLSEETISHRQRIAKKLGTLNGREQAKDRVLGDESIREFLLKQIPDLVENELRFENGTRPALLPEFHNRVDPVLLAHVYDGAVRYYEKAKGKVNASSLDALIRELKENAPQACQVAERFVFKHRVSGEGKAHGAHAEYLSDDLPSHTSPETLLQLQRQKMQLFFSSGKTLSVEHHLDNKRLISNVSTSVLTTRAREKAIVVSPALEKNEASQVAAVLMDLPDSKEGDATHWHGVPHGLPFLEGPSREPSAVPCIAWYFSEGARLKTFQLRVENKTWQMDFQNLRLPVFSPLLQQGSILASHQLAHEILCDYLSPVKRDEAGRIVLISGLAGLGKSRLVQHYLYQQDKVFSEERHAMVAWLLGQTEETFDAQWKALADEFRAIDSTLNGMDDSDAIKKWFEEQQSQWLLIIDDWQFLDIEKILKQLPSKGGHVVVTTRHPVTYFDHSEMQSQSRILLDLKLEPLSIDESKQLIEAHFGAHWKVLGHKEEAEALNTLVGTIGGFPQGLVQAATHVRKKGISFSRYVTQLTHSPALRWQLLGDTVLGTFTLAETLAYQWGVSKQLLLQRLHQILPDVPQVLHGEIFTSWLAQLASFMPSSFHQQEEEKSSADDPKLFSPEFLKQQWQAMITAKFPTLRERADMQQLLAEYQRGLSDYFPLHFAAPEGRLMLVSPVVHHLLLKGFPFPPVRPAEAGLADTGFKEALKEAGKEGTKQERNKEKKEEKRSGVPLIHMASFGENARVSHLRSDLLVLGSSDALRAWKLPTENVDFIPRPYVTNDLAKKLAVVNFADQDIRQVVLTTAVSGMGGVGKTELARHYLHHSHQNEDADFNRDYNKRFWFDASSLAQLSLSFRELGLALQLIEPKDDDTEVRKRVHKWLQLHPGWLVVFDNADDYQAVAEWIPAKGGTVLVTTRENAPGQLPDEQIVRVTVLEEQEAVQWLCQLSRRDESTLSVEEKSAVSELVKNLGYLPLAIVQVAAYLRSHPEILIAGYLEKLTLNAIGTLSGHQEIEAENEKAHVLHDSNAQSRQIIARTWHISLEAIEATAKQQGRSSIAKPLLAMCAYLAPTAIPVPILESWLELQGPHVNEVNKEHLSYVFDDHLSELLHYSLIQRDRDVNTISVHSLVQEVMCQEDKIALVQNEKIFTDRLRPLAEALNGLYPYDKKVEDYGRASLLLPHLMVVSSQLSPFLIRSSSDDGNNENTADYWQGYLLNAMVDFHLSVSNDARQAVDYCRQALGIRLQVYGDSNPFVAISYGNLGNAYHNLWDTGQALSYHEKALGILIQVHGNQHSNVATVYSNLGEAYDSLGDTKQAITYHQEALRIRQQVYGGQHPDAAISYKNLGAAYQSLGDMKQALEYHEKALAIRRKIYGDAHSDVADSYANLGAAYESLGNAKQALEYFEKALRICLQVHGDAHPFVAASYNYLGTAYKSVGDAKKAIEYHKKALGIYLKVHGDQHPAVAASYNNIGSAYASLGEAKKALDYYEKDLAISLQVYGDVHSNVAMSYNNIGTAYSSLGEAKKSLEYHEKALAIRLQVYGAAHPAVAASYNNLGTTYHSLGDEKQALIYYEKALAIWLPIYGSAHPNVAASYNNLGNSYKGLGDKTQAIIYHEKALAIWLQVYGDSHPDVATSYNNLGDAYQSLGDAKQMLIYQEKALVIRLQVYGDAHPDVAMSYNNIGCAYERLGDAKKALEYHEKALAIKRQVYGDTHPDVAMSYSNLGAAYHSLADVKKALEYQEKALNIRLQIYGDAHPDVAMSYSNLGAVYYRLGNYQKALECEEKALTIRLRVYGEAYSNPSIAASYNHLGSAYYSLGEAKQALIYYKKALGMRLQVYGDSHPDVAISYNSLGTAYQSLGDAQKGLECHEKALTIQLQVYGDAHPDVAIHYNNLGEAYRSLGDARKALECQEKALVIQLQAYGDSHPDVALSYEHIGTLFYQDTFNKPEVARTHWLKALFIYRKFKREQGIFRVEKHLANLTSSDALSAGAFRLSPAPLFKEKKGNPEQSLQSSSIISSASSSKPRDFSDYSTTVPMSFNVCSYWNKCKKPLGVAVSAAVVGLAAVYMAR